MVVRKVIDLYRKVDIVVIVDYIFIFQMFVFNYMDFYVFFVINEIVIVFIEESKYVDEMKVYLEKWYEIFVCDDVFFGFLDFNQDFCGYCLVMVMKFVDFYYGKFIFEMLVEKNINIYVNGMYIYVLKEIQVKNNRIVIRLKEIDLIGFVEFGSLDYFFIYKSVVEQYNFSYIILLDEINFKDFSKVDYYGQVEIIFGLIGKIIKVKFIVYGVIVFKDVFNRELVIEFFKFLFGEEGKKVFMENYQDFLNLLVVFGNVFEEIKGLVEVWEFILG